MKLKDRSDQIIDQKISGLTSEKIGGQQ